jgi:hypothetical protein
MDTLGRTVSMVNQPAGEDAEDMRHKPFHFLPRMHALGPFPMISGIRK